MKYCHSKYDNVSSFDKVQELYKLQRNELPTSDLDNRVLATPQRLSIADIAPALLEGGPHPCRQCAHGRDDQNHMPHERHGGGTSDPHRLVFKAVTL